MAYSEELAIRIRAALADREDIVEKRMFGGIAFMVGGSMACGIVGDDLMARVGPDAYEAALARPHARIMDFTGRPLRGFVLVSARGIRTAAALKTWVEAAATFATSLPRTKKSGKKRGASSTATPLAKRKADR